MNPITQLLDVMEYVVELIFKLGSRILNGSGLDFFSCFVLCRQKPSDRLILLSGRPKKSVRFAV